ncbi:hypothetical protein JVU11DRAFT_12794 [Chiua virens]|nr:hypothetical protein JVU11DRAFT_12794 [Chiua virens]
MAALYRLTACAVLDVAPRKLVSAPFGHSAMLSSATLSAEQFQGPVPQIFDIFDAPVHLREKKLELEPLKVFNPLSTARATSIVAPSHSRSVYSAAFDLPWSLPPPITFDGPACPPHMSPSTLKRRRLQRQNVSHFPRRLHGSSTVSCTQFTSQSEPLYKLFDGPSRIVRYQYPTSPSERSSLAYISLALCLSSTFGWLVFKDKLDLFQNENGRSA